MAEPQLALSAVKSLSNNPGQAKFESDTSLSRRVAATFADAPVELLLMSVVYTPMPYVRVPVMVRRRISPLMRRLTLLHSAYLWSRCRTRR
jgi:hypothetical protein